MNISNQNAMQIVADISGIINQHVNMMDETGMIIASTDPERIGTYHEAAARLIKENLEMLVIHDDREYAGSRKGINLPILQQGKIAGVIGVTGQYETVAKYVQIIKRMTEILLLENYYKEQKKIDDRIRTRFLDEWLFSERSFYSPEFIERGRHLGIDITLPRRVLAAEIRELEHYVDTPEGQRLIDSINRVVRGQTEQDSRNVFAKTSSRMLCLLADRDDSAMERFAHAIRRETSRMFQIEILVGIDGRHSAVMEASRQAQRALRVSGFSNRDICFYNHIPLELLTDEIPEEARNAYLASIFGGMNREEMLQWARLLQVYYDCNGSISAAANKLYIHKNTLQYRLKRLGELTGYDPRSLSHSVFFGLALQFLTDKL